MFIDKVIFNKNSVTVIVFWGRIVCPGDSALCNMNKYDSIDCDIGLAAELNIPCRDHFWHCLFCM